MKTKIEITLKGSKAAQYVQEFVNLADTSLESAICFEKEKIENGEIRVPYPEFLAAYAIVVKVYGLTDLSRKVINYHLFYDGIRFSDLVAAFRTIKYIIKK